VVRADVTCFCLPQLLGGTPQWLSREASTMQGWDAPISPLGSGLVVVVQEEMVEVG